MCFKQEEKSSDRGKLARLERCIQYRVNLYNKRGIGISF